MNHSVSSKQSLSVGRTLFLVCQSLCIWFQWMQPPTHTHTHTNIPYNPLEGTVHRLDTYSPNLLLKQSLYTNKALLQIYMIFDHQLWRKMSSISLFWPISLIRPRKYPVVPLTDCRFFLAHPDHTAPAAKALPGSPPTHGSPFTAWPLDLTAICLQRLVKGSTF